MQSMGWLSRSGVSLYRFRAISLKAEVPEYLDDESFSRIKDISREIERMPSSLSGKVADI